MVLRGGTKIPRVMAVTAAIVDHGVHGCDHEQWLRWVMVAMAAFLGPGPVAAIAGPWQRLVPLRWDDDDDD